MRSHSRLIRLGLWMLPISGLAFTIGYLINGALPNPSAGAAFCMATYGTPRFAWGAYVNLGGMLLSTFGFFALFAHLTSRGPSRPALSGMISSVLGLELTLVGYGVIAFGLPLLGRLVLEAELPARQVFTVATNPLLLLVLLVASCFYFAGSVLFSVALWRNRLFPKAVALGMSLAAFFLAFNPLLPMPALWGGVLGALLLLASTGWIAWHAAA